MSKLEVFGSGMLQLAQAEACGYQRDFQAFSSFIVSLRRLKPAAAGEIPEHFHLSCDR